MRIGGAAQVGGTVVDAGRIRLPDLDQCIAHQGARAVEDPARDGYALAAGVVIHHPAAEVFRIHTRNVAEIGGEPDMDIWSGGLRGSLFQIIKRLGHQLPSSRFSNRVERRPRRMMSNL